VASGAIAPGAGKGNRAPGGGAASREPPPGSGSTRSASAAPPGPGTAGGPQVKPDGEPSSGRLDVDAASGGGRNRTASTAVAANTTFWLTDVTLGAPQGDAGELDISIGGKPPFLTLSLATFRGPQDFHWVSPIQVPAGGQLVMNLTCTTAGPALPSRPANRCWEWMSWSGVMQPAQP